MAQVVASEEAVAELARAIDGLQALELHDLSDDDLSRLVVELEVQRSRLGGVGAAVVRVFDRRGRWALEGAKSAAAWIAHRCRLPLAAARKATRMGRRLRDLPATRAALEAGEITEAHAERLVRAATRKRRAALARDEEMLVGQAKELSFAEFHKAVTYWEQLADPDGVEDAADAEEAGRWFHLSPSLGGSWVMDGQADPIRGTIIHNVLSPIERELFEADWAEAKAKYGDDVTVDLLARTPAQRRLDALVEMARRAATAPKDGKRPRPLFTVLVDYPTVSGRVCELANGTPVTPGGLVPWLTAAEVERVVFDGSSRVIDIGARQRFFRGATRRAVEVRDRVCWHPTCEEPAERCDIDHIVRFEHGGPTVQANGRPACPPHNEGRRQPLTSRVTRGP